MTRVFTGPFPTPRERTKLEGCKSPLYDLIIDLNTTPLPTNMLICIKVYWTLLLALSVVFLCSLQKTDVVLKRQAPAWTSLHLDSWSVFTFFMDVRQHRK
jgi:hypothetical protein